MYQYLFKNKNYFQFCENYDYKKARENKKNFLLLYFVVVGSGIRDLGSISMQIRYPLPVDNSGFELSKYPLFFSTGEL
jgi:hypothetical protein